MSDPVPSVLDNPVWHAVVGQQRGFGDVSPESDQEGRPLAVRFKSEVGPFAGLADPADPRCWDALASLVPAGDTAAVVGLDGFQVGEGWDVAAEIPGVQMVAGSLEPAAEGLAVPLGPPNATEMLNLVAQTRPGPFGPRTVELGGFLGIRHHGRLVAMAGQRFRPPGFAEISAVCTDAAHRGQGLGGRLVRAVAEGMAARGDIPFLHAAASNVNAIRLYETLGMEVARSVRFVVVRATG